MLGTKSEVFLWRLSNTAHILFKILVEYSTGIYLELFDEELQITERLQYYFVMSCESMAFAFMVCVGLFPNNIRCVFDATHGLEYKMSKFYSSELEINCCSVLNYKLCREASQNQTQKVFL